MPRRDAACEQNYADALSPNSERIAHLVLSPGYRQIASMDRPGPAIWRSRYVHPTQWDQHFAPLATSIQLMLKMLRESGSTQKVMATGGQLQQNLPQGRNFQLLRLRIDDSLNLTPEISCNRLLVVIRLMQQQEDGKLITSRDDTPFEMTLCA